VSDYSEEVMSTMNDILENDESHKRIFSPPRVKEASDQSAEEPVKMTKEELAKKAVMDLVEASKALDELGLTKSAEGVLMVVAEMAKEASKTAASEPTADIVVEAESEEARVVESESGDVVWPEDGSYKPVSEAKAKMMSLQMEPEYMGVDLKIDYK
jgi:hypothetical protein